MKRLLLSSIVSLALSAPVMAADGDQVNITILGTSDIHGRFVPWDYSEDKANTMGSLSQIATKVKEIRNQETNVIMVDAGDTIQGNFVETFKDGPIAPMMLGFNHMKYDAWVMGNHEFDFGLKTLNMNIEQFKGAALGGNIKRADGNPFLPAYTIVERGGVKVGIIGMDTPMTQAFAEGSDRLGGVTFTNPSLEVKKVINEIADQVDSIILVAHMGLDNENDIADTGVTDIANANPELDAIVAGHMHTLVDKAVVNGVIITEPDRHGRALSRIDLQFEERNGKFSLINKDSFTYKMKDMSSDSEMEKIYQPYHDKLRADANRVIAKLTGVDLVAPTVVRGIPQIHIQDNPITALFHEASFYYSPKANVIALQLDNDYPSLDVGDIKAKDIAFNAQYAGGEVTVFEMNGKDLKTYIEWSVDYLNSVKDGDVTYSFNPNRRSSKYNTDDSFGGVTYVADLSKPMGQRVSQLAFIDGQPITDETEIRLGMYRYRLDQLTKKGGVLEGRTFPVLSDSKQLYGDEEGTIRNMTIRYLTEVKKGQYEGKPVQRWTLVGLKGYDKERQIVERLLNEGKISVPVTKDGRFTNVASINVKGLIFANKAELERFVKAQQEELLNADDAEKRDIERNIIIAKAINKF